MNIVLIKQLRLMPGITTFRSQATAVQLCVGKTGLKIPYPVNGNVEGLFVSFGFLQIVKIKLTLEQFLVKWLYIFSKPQGHTFSASSYHKKIKSIITQLATALSIFIALKP